MRLGFSLVELSIVLVILGLLTGGILSGQALIRASELRSVSTDIGRYTTSINTFRDKYFALPGDMRNATKFWQAANTAGTGGECADANANTGTGTQTCNGNGNGMIDDYTLVTTKFSEMWRIWQHLANAGLIEGTYTGVTGPDGLFDGVIGVNSPASKISRAGFSARYFSDVAADGGTGNNYYAGSYGNLLIFGTDSGSSYTYLAAIKPEEAWNIDTKMDDGKPAKGRIITFRTGGTYTPNCANNTSNALAEYDLTEQSNACSFLIRMAY